MTNNNNFCFIKAFNLCAEECKKECRCAKKDGHKNDSRLNYFMALSEAMEAIERDEN